MGQRSTRGFGITAVDLLKAPFFVNLNLVGGFNHLEKY
jgi:hypothetical protein